LNLRAEYARAMTTNTYVIVEGCLSLRNHRARAANIDEYGRPRAAWCRRSSPPG